MKTTLIFLLSFCAWSATAQFDPLTKFPEGEYLGRGRFVAADDRSDNYASHALFSADRWELSYFSEIGMHYYTLSFMFTEVPKGVFVFEMTRKTPTPGSGTYVGHGFCGSSQCLLYATLNDGFMEEVITFHKNSDKIYRLGLLHDSTGIIRWEEEMRLIKPEINI